MVAHEVFAMIHNNVIQSVCVAYSYEDASKVARAVYGENALAVDCLQYPCEAGDKYIDGIFYKSDGITPIKYVPTQEQQVARLTEELTAAQLALAEQYEANLALQEEVTNTQLALAEIYEGREA
ncbi:MAG: hypothetical protein LIP16_05380 [Clostridium sp.]|nr:hypothetical protein [Clostridium sp.]